MSPEYEERRRKHAREMAILGGVQIILVLALIAVRIYNAVYR